MAERIQELQKKKDRWRDRLVRKSLNFFLSRRVFINKSYPLSLVSLTQKNPQVTLKEEPQIEIRNFNLVKRRYFHHTQTQF